MRSDLQIEDDVGEELATDPEVVGAAVSVHVGAGIARLSGTTPTYAARIAARRAAERIAGVRAILDDVLVEPPAELRRSDMELSRAVEIALGLSVQVPDTVEASVIDGWVILEGHVPHQAERCAAEAAVAVLAGVRGIQNRIRLTPQPAAGCALVHAIEKAIRRSAELDCKHIVVDATPEGEVFLRGVVRSWAELHDAERAAWSTPGVTSVINRLTVVL